MRIGLATCAALPDGWPDDRLLAEALRERGAEARFAVWDDPGVDWPSFDLVMIRSTWDYTRRRAGFLDWARSIGGALHNPAAVLEWNSDKRYLGDLTAAGVATVPTRYVEPGEPLPDLEGEVVVKPTVSAGARDTGRFGPGRHDSARGLLGRIAADGRTAMLQPYLDGVEELGETSIVAFDATESHVLKKRPVLGADEIAPVQEGEITAAKAMFDPELVGPGAAGAAERSLAERVLGELQRRFSVLPLYARIDMIPGPDGAPVLIELEAVEPSLYLGTQPGSEARLAEAILKRAGWG